MNKDELIFEVGRLLLQDPQVSNKSWEDMVVVPQITDKGQGIYGFLYDIEGKPSPIAPKDPKLIIKLRELQNITATPAGDFWTVCIIRINRTTAKISIDFEYDHPEKWKISPKNYTELGDRLRPNKGSSE